MMVLKQVKSQPRSNVTLILVIVMAIVMIMGWVFYYFESDKNTYNKTRRLELEEKNLKLIESKIQLMKDFNKIEHNYKKTKEELSKTKIENIKLKKKRNEIHNEIKSISSTNVIQERFRANGFSPVLYIR